MLSPNSRRALAVIITLAAVLASTGVRVRAQGPAQWQFEDVATGNVIPGCTQGMTPAGFDLDPQGRPVVAWREENRCGGPPRVFWTRLEGGSWNTHEFFSTHRYEGGGMAGFAHQMILRPSDGNPFLVFGDVGGSNSLNTWVTDLGANPVDGWGVFLEALVPEQNCAFVDYSLAFAPGAALPDWATGLALCGGYGPVKLDGAIIEGGVPWAHPALTVAPDGTRHMLWNTGTDVIYTRWPVAAGPTTSATPLFTNVNRFGGEVRLASDAGGVLHAAIRGVEGNQADYDLGAVVYLTSTDGGETWTPFEYIDPADAVPNSLGANSDISLALDANGIPAVTYWRGTTELWYARRDGPGGTWTRSLITTQPGGVPRANQVRFDNAGNPVVAFYDSNVNMVRLARPVPVNRAPVLETPPNQSSYEHTSVSVQLTATDPDGDAVTFSAVGLPPGVTLDPATGAISGLIPYHAAGVYPVTITASDGTLTSTLGLTWTVLRGACNPFAQDDSATTTQNTAVSIAALDNDISPASCGPVPFRLDAFSNPSHGTVVFDNSVKGGLGVFIYTPAPGFAGVDTFTYTIVNSDGSSNMVIQATVAITVRDITPPVITVPANITSQATGPNGVAVTYVVSANDAVSGPTEFGCVPASGSIFPIGVTTVVCNTADAEGNTATATFTVTVSNPPPPAGLPVVTNPGNQTDYLGDFVHLPIVAVDPNGDSLIFLLAGQPGLPFPVPGLSLNRTSGVIIGRPTQSGVFAVTVLVTDQHTPPVAVTFTWTVIDDHRPTLAIVNDQTSVAGVADSLQLHGATVPAGGALTYSASGLPAGLAIDATTGLISGTPTLANTAIAPAVVEATVRDSAGATTSRTFGWRVLDPNGADLEISASARGPQDPQAPQRLGLMVTITNHGSRRVGGGGSTFGVVTARIDVPSDWTGAVWSCSLQPPGPGSPSALMAELFPAGRHGSVDLNVRLNPNQTLTCGTHGPNGDLSVDAVASVSAPISPADSYLANNIAVVHYPEAAAPGAHAPLLMNPGDQQGIEGDDANLQLAASDPDGDPLSFGLVTGALPKGLHLDGVTGIIGASLAPVSGGDYPLTVAVTDGAAMTLQSFVWHVAVRTVTLANPGPQLDAAGRPIRLDLQVADRNNNPIAMTAAGLPAGLVLRSSPNSRQWWIEGQATPAAIGPHAVTLTASSGGPSITRTFEWTIGPNLAPTLDNPGAQSNAGGQVVNLQLRATDPYGDRVTYGVGLLGLPPGLSLNPASGLITGTVPFSVFGLYFSGVTATVGTQTSSQVFLWTIIRNSAPTLADPPNQITTEGTPVHLALSGVDPDGNALTYGIAPGRTLPPGLSLDPATGLITGAPHTSATAVTFTVGVFVQDSWGVRSTVQTFTWRINRKPVIEDPRSQVSIVGRPLPTSATAGAGPFRIAAYDPDLDPTTITVTGLPTGITFVLTTKVVNGRNRQAIGFVGTPAAAGDWTVTVTATDSFGATTVLSFDWLVLVQGQGDLAASATASGSGNQVMFTVEVANRGPVAVTNATVVVTEPPNLISPFPGPVRWTCVRDATTFSGPPINAAGNLTLNISRMLPGGSVQCSTLKNASNTPPTYTGASVTISVTATAANDGYAANNTAVVVHPPQP